MKLFILLGLVSTAAALCYPGTQVCNAVAGAHPGKSYWVCQYNGMWKHTKCPYGQICLPGSTSSTTTCVEPCTEGDRQCLGDNILQECVYGVWTDIEICILDDKKCTTETDEDPAVDCRCVDDTTRCGEDGRELCVDGEWDPYPCPAQTACVEDGGGMATCPSSGGECTPDGLERCLGDIPQVCSGNMWVHDPNEPGNGECPGPKVCVLFPGPDAQCVDCVPGSTTCTGVQGNIGNNIKGCNAEGESMGVIENCNEPGDNGNTCQQTTPIFAECVDKPNGNPNNANVQNTIEVLPCNPYDPPTCDGTEITFCKYGVLQTVDCGNYKTCAVISGRGKCVRRQCTEDQVRCYGRQPLECENYLWVANGTACPYPAKCKVNAERTEASCVSYPATMSLRNVIRRV